MAEMTAVAMEVKRHRSTTSQVHHLHMEVLHHQHHGLNPCQWAVGNNHLGHQHLGLPLHQIGDLLHQEAIGLLVQVGLSQAHHSLPQDGLSQLLHLNLDGTVNQRHNLRPPDGNQDLLLHLLQHQVALPRQQHNHHGHLEQRK